MARRRLEAAIRAGKAIQQETSVTFLHVERQLKYTYDAEHDGVYSLQFSYDGNKLAVGYGDGSIEILDSSNGQRNASIRTGGQRAMAVMAIRYHPKLEDIVVAGTSDGFVLIQSELTCRQLVHEPKNEINCLDFSQDGSRFATAGRDLNVRVYDVETLENVMTYEGCQPMTPGCELAVGHYQRIFGLKYHPDDVHVFITAGWDNVMRIWDARTSTGVQRTIPGPHISGDGLDIRGTYILTASWVQNNALQLWDYRKGCLVQNLPFCVKEETVDSGNVTGAGDSGERIGNGAYLYCGQFCTNDVVVAGGSGTKSVQTISRQTGQMLSEIKLKRAVYALDSAQNGRLIAVAGSGNRVLISVMS